MKNRVNRLSEEEHRLVTQAVGDAEAHTDGEIVTIVAAASDDYRQTPWIWSVAALFFYLSSLVIFPNYYLDMLALFGGGWELEISLAGYLALILLGSLISFSSVFLVTSLWPIRILLTPRAHKAERARARAIELFRVGAERRTMGLTGILIYLSLAEHRAEIVADEAIADKVDAQIWGEAMADMLAELKAGHPGAAMARAVAKVGTVLSEHFPKSDGNPNELPDRLIEL